MKTKKLALPLWLAPTTRHLIAQVPTLSLGARLTASLQQQQQQQHQLQV
jgi:hypothetical protein